MGLTSRLLKIVRWGAKGLGAILGTVLILELCLRLALPEQLRSAVDLAPVYTPDENVGYRYIANAEGTMCVPMCRSVRINPGGLLGANYRVEKDPGVYRIAVLDASNATGLWMVEGEPYPAQLEMMLKDAGIQAEVFNFSIDGLFRTYESARLARDVVPLYAPDLVLMLTELPFVYTNTRRMSYRGYVVNYPGGVASAQDHARMQIDYIESHRVAIALYRASYVVRAVARSYVSGAESWRVPYVRAFIERRWRDRLRGTPFSTQRSIDVLIDVKRRLEQSGTKLLLVRYADEQEVPLEAAARGLEFVTIRRPEGHAVDPKYNPHPNAEGSRIIAQQLWALLPWGEGSLRVASAATD
jgi:hypothetical protein